MKVTRKVPIKTTDICVGDQIMVKLKGFGKFTATAQKVTDNAVLFLFDDIIAVHSMNSTDTNKGRYEESEMKKWLYQVVLPAFPEKMRSKIISIALPSFGEIFGHDDYYCGYIEPDEDEQFTLMKKSSQRVCDFNEEMHWWWVRNAVNNNISSADFAYVDYSGLATYYNASTSGGVRPEFWLKGENENE